MCLPGCWLAGTEYLDSRCHGNDEGAVILAPDQVEGRLQAGIHEAMDSRCHGNDADMVILANAGIHVFCLLSNK